MLRSHHSGSSVMVRALHKNVPAAWRLQAPGPQLPQALKLHGSQRDPASQQQVTQAGAVWDSGAEWGARESCHGPARLPEPVRRLWGLGSQNPEVPGLWGKAAQFRAVSLRTDTTSLHTTANPSTHPSPFWNPAHPNLLR